MWSITEPDHGSDLLDFSHSVSPVGQGGLKSNCVVIKKGDKFLIRGQKSSWGSNGSIAHVSALFCRYDDGSGEAKCAAFIVPLDLPGVSRGKPLDKLGVRSLTDAELFFDDVEIPASYMLCPPEAYDELLAGILIGANPGMAIFSVGQARAAFELALAYAKERVQGGKPIFEHQAVRLKLFDMYRKIQAARALIRKTMLDHAQFAPRFENSVASKVTGTQTALEVTNQAFEIFGGNATTKEYPIEKLLRDARMGTIADGTNDVLSLMAAALRF
jgi:alkylation response protein AidB-like acyl-CoA dehydrogenase